MSDLRENRLEAVLQILKFPTNMQKFYALDPSQDWVQAELNELNENSELPMEQLAQKSHLHIELDITKKFTTEMGDYMLVSGHVESRYCTQCVRSLEEMSDTVELEINACFIDKNLEADDQFQDQLQIYLDGKMRELYFYEDKKVDLRAMLHEQIWLNVDRYPKTSDEGQVTTKDPKSLIQ